jgi:hypothetical protein
MSRLKHRVDQLEQRSPSVADPVAIERSITTREESGRPVDRLASIWIDGVGSFARADDETEVDFRGRVKAAAEQNEQQKGRADA